VLPIPASAYPTPAKRDHRTHAGHLALACTFGLHLPDWQHGVRHILQQIL
jgi:dTDP-4-dehydrorhamnose reductase